jgi:hypothetical protein
MTKCYPVDMSQPFISDEERHQNAIEARQEYRDLKRRGLIEND